MSAVLDWDNWHRITANLPLTSQEKSLRDEANQLVAERDQALAQNYHQNINWQLDALFKRSFIEGFVYLELGFRTRQGKQLLPQYNRGERVLYECPTTLFKLSSSNDKTWDELGTTKFIVTDAHFWFEGDIKNTPVTFAEVENIEVQYK